MRLSVNKLTVHRAGINRLAIELILIPSRGCTTDPPHALDRRWRSRRHNSGIDHTIHNTAALVAGPRRLLVLVLVHMLSLGETKPPPSPSFENTQQQEQQQ